MFKAFITVKHNEIYLWNKTIVNLAGYKTDLINLQQQLVLIKHDINSDINKQSLALRDVSITITI